jgi:secreted Zn-dependent insulinase-like peptidase
MRDTYGILGFGFQVVSASHPIELILKSTMKFIYEIPHFILNMEKRIYQNNINALISTKMEIPVSLSESADVNWTQIDERRFHFTSKYDQVKILQDVNLISQDVLSTFSKNLFDGSDTRLMIVETSVENSQVPVISDDPNKQIENVFLASPMQLHTYPGVILYPNLA